LVALTMIATSCPATHKALPKPTPIHSPVLSIARLSDGAPSTYLAIEYNRPPNHILMLRDSTDGHFIRELYRSTDEFSAIRASDGTVLLFLRGSTDTMLYRIGPSTVSPVAVRTIPNLAYNPVLSPDGNTIAYATYPSDYQSKPGLVGYLPYEVDVFDLRTGGRTSTVSDNPGHPFFGVTWSPDGTQLAANYAGGENGGTIVMLLDASHPSFRAARRINAPRGCSFEVSAWTASGLIGSESCGSRAIFPSRLVQITAEGRITREWPVPQCASGAGAFTDATLKPVLVFVRTGYGSGTWCGRHLGHYIYELTNGKLRLVAKHIEKIERYLHDGNPIGW
jgi:hypothetical protein